MAYPTQEQPNPGAPQQPAGAPWPPAGVPQGFAPAPQSNGMATAGLILGIIPTGVIGLTFSVLGIIRAGKLGGTGRGKAWTGLVLSALWIIALTAIIGIGGSTAVKHTVACSQTETKVTALSNKLEDDAADPAAYQKDLQSLVSELNSSAAKVSDKKTAADMRKAAADFQEFLDDSTKGTVPSDDLVDRLTTDGTAVDLDCS